MPLKTDTIEEPHLNLTPMIDIVFLLIIFFMVGTEFTELERQYDIKLPTVSDVQPITGRPDELVINVKSDGQVTVNGQERTLPQLEEELTRAKKSYADQAVVVRGEGEGRYQTVVDVLAICNRVNISVISLAWRMQRRGE